MGMEGGVGRKCIPAAWGMGAKLCDSCKAAAALLFCRVDSVFLCIGCDAKVHHRGGVGNTRHERVWMCDVCEQAPASVTCKADAAALCVTCDGDVHSANLLAHRHERVPVAPFYDLAESVAKSAVAASNFLKITEDQGTHTCLVDPESDPPSWVSPNPTTKVPPVDQTEMKSLELLFSESDQFLDFDCPIGIHDSGTDSVVPVRAMKSLPPTTQQMMNPSSDNYLEIDFSSPKFNSYNNSNNCFTAQSHTHSFSSSSMDVGVVPDGSSMSEISYSYGKISNNSVDLGGSVNTASFSHGSDREARVLRYREKRKNRKFQKTIRYASRKAYAETRPRIKGRFAKRTDMDTELVNRYFNSGSNFPAEDAGYGVVPSFS